VLRERRGRREEMDLAVACVERGEEERCINREKRVGMCIGVRLLSRV
jgi:hypothetical protein